jgi:hypothetical protein
MHCVCKNAETFNFKQHGTYIYRYALTEFSFQILLCASRPDMENTYLNFQNFSKFFDPRYQMFLKYGSQPLIWACKINFGAKKSTKNDLLVIL